MRLSETRAPCSRRSVRRAVVAVVDYWKPSDWTRRRRVSEIQKKPVAVCVCDVVCCRVCACVLFFFCRRLVGAPSLISGCDGGDCDDDDKPIVINTHTHGPRCALWLPQRSIRADKTGKKYTHTHTLSHTHTRRRRTPQSCCCLPEPRRRTTLTRTHTHTHAAQSYPQTQT